VVMTQAKHCTDYLVSLRAEWTLEPFLVMIFFRVLHENFRAPSAVRIPLFGKHCLIQYYVQGKFLGTVTSFWENDEGSGNFKLDINSPWGGEPPKSIG
jgi:hypothetical protein